MTSLFIELIDVCGTDLIRESSTDLLTAQALVSRSLRGAIALIVLLCEGCAPKGGTMQVAYLKGNWAYGVTQGMWDYGETRECQLASRSSQPPDKRLDVLVCGSDTELAWNLGWLRPDLRNKIYENARLLKVRFRSSGHSSRNKGTWWICKRNDEEIICD